MCTSSGAALGIKMFFLVITLVFVAMAYARPDISGSYLPSGGQGIQGGCTPCNLVADAACIGGCAQIGGVGIGGIGVGGIGIGGIGVGGGEQKQVFYFAAPDDESQARFRVYVSPSSSKSTKIIFVKAPGGGGVIPEVIAPPSSAEEKTKIFVLAKQQQRGGSVSIPSGLGLKSAKPEVYFLRYASQNQAEQAVQSALQGGGVGNGLSDLGNEGAFIRTLSAGGFTSSTTGTGGLGIGTGGIGIGTGGISTNYGTPGGSGPYKR